MKSRQTSARLVGLFLALMMCHCALEADDVQVRHIEVAPGITMLMGAGGNLGVSHGTDGTLVVDDQYARMSPKILAALDEIGAPPLRYVINTHWHGDHTGGNANMKEAGAVIVAQDNVRDRMSRANESAAFGRRIPASPSEALPVITFSDNATLHFNGLTIRAEHVARAHTDGDSVIFFDPVNVVHMGDLYFNGFFPFVDFSSGGDPKGMVAGVDSVLARIDDETRVIPGHGLLSNRTELVAYRDMLSTVSDRIGAAIAEGKSMEEIVAMKPTREFDAKWGGDFLSPDRFVQVVYLGLAK